MENIDSSPMVPSFMVSAPGKVIVLGEDAAVYGRPVIAAAISLRSYLSVKALSKSEQSVTLNFKDIKMHHTWDIASLPWEAFQQAPDRKLYHSHVDSLDQTLLDAIKPHVDLVSPNLPEKERKIYIGSATAFLYLFLSLGSPESHGFVYTLRSIIPVGAGLGSRPHPDQPVEEAEQQSERINNWAYAGEVCIHGDLSGVDKTVSCRGKAVLFCKNMVVGRDKGKPSSITPINQFPSLRLLLVHTKQPRTTVDQVEKVRRLKNEQPGLFEQTLDQIGQLTEKALKFFSSFSPDYFGDRHDRQTTVENLGGLLCDNQKLLARLGVSHPLLDRICELAATTNVGWEKLTGAGGGGCAIILPRPDVKEDDVQALDQDLAMEGFEKHETVLGTAGVGLLLPTVFRNGAHGEIDFDAFENAVDSRSIERRAGIGGRLTGKDCCSGTGVDCWLPFIVSSDVLLAHG
ncbi:mevalonate kinase [Aspergillus sclerotialis]|uniref:Mevalonate kinase n=1 Tax=Aspergillus sclerotialis TaxID=2070753 RepID=A0A3A2ZWW6_9EURO|nr:mevalonate kinase [Aspergillus sclerotialis]